MNFIDICSGIGRFRSALEINGHIYKAKDSGVSNSQLYKQAGNSVSVPVVDAIVKCL